MSINNLPRILIRKCEERKGIRITESYFESWCAQRQLSSDMESEYTALVSDFLNTEMSTTSSPVIPQDIATEPITTFPPVNLRRGGGVVLEIVDVDDLSNSALSILESLTNTTQVRRGVVTNDIQPEIQRGTLHWILSDGTTHIHAMENETIPSLSLLTPFGCKLLIKSCQVRRGMLLLDNNSVTVLGGETPAVYNYNMSTELINRLRIRLGLNNGSSNTTTTATAANVNTNTNTNANTNTNINTNTTHNALDGSTLINQSTSSTIVNSAIDLDEIEDYDDLDNFNSEMFCDALASAEAGALANLNKSGNQGADNGMDDFIDDGYDDDDWDIEMLDQVMQKPTVNATTATTTTATTLNNSSTAINNNKRQQTVIDCDDAGEGSSGMSDHDKKRQRLATSKNSPSPIIDSSDELDWNDKEMWNLVDTTNNENNQEDENKRQRWSLDKLHGIIRSIESDEPVNNIPDIVVIRGTFKKLGQLRLTSTTGFYLVGYLHNPLNKNDESLRLLFRSKVITELLNGKTSGEILEMSKSPSGREKVAKDIVKPLQNALISQTADIEVDLSLCEKDRDSILMPLVMSYTPIK